MSSDEKEFLDKRFSDSLSYRETVNRIKYGIEIRPVCKICGGQVEFVGRKNNMFASTCCKEHWSLLTSKNFLEYNAKLSEEEHNSKAMKCKETKMMRYGKSTYNNSERRLKTCNEIYGGNAPACSIEVKNRIKKSLMEKYGVESTGKLSTNNFKTNNPQKNENIKERTKETNIARYGGNSPTCSEIVRNKQRNSMKVKYASTRFDRLTYIKDNLHKFIDLNNIQYAKICDVLNEISIDQCICPFKTSIGEDITFLLLLTKYEEVVRQYKSDSYPFYCDLYVPSKDLYVECNYYWTHGFHQYDSTNENDVKKIELWKSKSSKFYDNAIYTWTVADPNKRKTAKENNLNYIELWSLKDCINFLNSDE